MLLAVVEEVDDEGEELAAELPVGVGEEEFLLPCDQSNNILGTRTVCLHAHFFWLARPPPTPPPIAAAMITAMNTMSIQNNLGVSPHILCCLPS